MKGRKPLPQEVLNLRGTARKDRERPLSTSGEKISVADLRKCQEVGLKSIPERARAIYWKTCRQMALTGILEARFLPQLIVYAVNYNYFLECCEEIDKNGKYIMVRNDVGEVTSVIENPAIKSRQRAAEMMLKVGSNFGMSPVDNQKIRIVSEEKDKKVKSIMAMVEFEDESVDDQ